MYFGLPAYRRQWARFGFGEEDLEEGGSDRLIDTLIAWGDEGAIRERIASHMEAGASRIVIIPYNPERRSPGPHWKLLETLAPGPARGGARVRPAKAQRPHVASQGREE
jgi:hypothetical protein